MIYNLCRWYVNKIDDSYRASRDLGFSIDEGLPDRGSRYGGAQTIHNTGTIDIVMDSHNVVTEVWFRCATLPFRVSHPKGNTAYENTAWGRPVIAIEFAK